MYNLYKKAKEERFRAEATMRSVREKIIEVATAREDVDVGARFTRDKINYYLHSNVIHLNDPSDGEALVLITGSFYISDNTTELERKGIIALIEEYTRENDISILENMDKKLFMPFLSERRNEDIEEYLTV